jgi:hypothetical protein
MACVVRPGESIRGLSLQGESMLRKMIQPAQMPLTYCEIGLWRVPIAALGTDFMEIIAKGARDVYENIRASRGVVAGSTGIPVGASTTSQGAEQRGLEYRHRPWAGEPGYADADATSDDSHYAPYVSHGTYLIAQSYYDIDWFAMPVSSTSDDLFEEPPKLGPFIRGSSQMSVSDVTSELDTFDSTDGIGALLERVSVLEGSERTWSEYLAANGTPPHMATSIPQPLLVEQGLISPYGSPQLPHVAWQDTQTENFTGSNSQNIQPDNTRHQRILITADTDKDLYYLADEAGLSVAGRTWKRFRTRDMRIWEPSIIIGTALWWKVATEPKDFVHVMDATKFISRQHWGDTGTGDLDESDFIAVSAYRDNVGLAGTVDDTGNLSSDEARVANHLNHYLHGDTFSYPTGGQDFFGTLLSGDEFTYRASFGQASFDANRTVNHKLSARLHIATDLVG